jgi:S-adenosylmethionine hydrolase
VTGPFVSLLSDFGSRDPSAAIMRGVVLAIAPEARIVDNSHDVRK